MPTDNLPKRPIVTPFGDVKAATARAANTDATTNWRNKNVGTTARGLDAPNVAAPTPSGVALKAPADFVVDSAGNVQRNTPSLQWDTAPGAAADRPMTSAARMIQAPNWQTTAGAGPGPGAVDFGAPTPPPPSPGDMSIETPEQASRRQFSAADEARRAAARRVQALNGTPNLETTPPTSSAARMTGAPQGPVYAPGDLPDYRNPNPDAPRGTAFRQTPTPTNPNYRPAAPEPAAASPAPAAAEPAPKAARAKAPKPSLGEAPTSPHRTFRMTEPEAGSFGSRVNGIANAVEKAPATGFIGKSGRAITRTLGAAGRLAGAAYGINQANSAIRDMRDEGANAANVGDAAAGTAGVALASNKARRALASGAAKLLGEKVGARAVPVLGAAATGWDIGRAIAPAVNRIADSASGVQDTIGGTINGIVRGAGHLIGQDWGASEADEEALARLNSQAARNEMAGRKPWDNGGRSSAEALASQPAQGGASVPTTGAPAGSPATAPTAAAGTPVPTAPTGTATINGRTLSPEEIASAAARLNTVPSAAFTDPGTGQLYSESHGGATPTTDQAIAFRQGMNQSPAGQRMFGTDANGNPVGIDGGIGAPQDRRQATINNLMGQINDALRSGRRRTAKILVSQLGAFDRATQGDMDASIRRDALNRGPQTTPQTAAQQLLDVSRAQQAQNEAQVAQMSVEQAKEVQAIQQKLRTESDPAKRKVLLQNLSAVTGKGAGRNNIKMADFTVGDGLNSRKIPIPVDMDTGKPVVSPEYLKLITSLQGGQPQA